MGWSTCGPRFLVGAFWWGRCWQMGALRRRSIWCAGMAVFFLTFRFNFDLWPQIRNVINNLHDTSNDRKMADLSLWHFYPLVMIFMLNVGKIFVPWQYDFIYVTELAEWAVASILKSGCVWRSIFMMDNITSFEPTIFVLQCEVTPHFLTLAGTLTH